MQRSVLGLATALAVTLFLTSSAFADGDDPRIEAFEDRLMALEDRLAQSEQVIAAQNELLKDRATPAVSQGGAVDAFLSGLEVGGHVTTSYIYNFNNPAPGASGSQPLCQFNCNNNEFKVDAAKLEIGKAASNPGDAGFQLDLLLGQNADISRFLSPTAGGAGVFGDDDFSLFIQQAYVSYNWNDIELKMGNFETLLGWELIDSHKNYNVTHGILFTWTIPLYHTGVMASGSLGENIGWSLGAVNGFNNTVETNDSKGLLGQVSVEEGPFFGSISGYFGADAGGGAGQPSSADIQRIIDIVATYTPRDDLTFWLNVDVGTQEDGDPTGGDADWWGVAVGTNITLSEQLSFALRGEYFEDDEAVRGIAGTVPGVTTDFEAYSLTGTLAYKLTDHLTLRTELRYDKADDDRLVGSGGSIFPDDDPSLEDDTLYGIVEVSYLFD